MEINKGDEFLAVETGTIYRVYAVSAHRTQVVLASRKTDQYDFVVHMNPERIEAVIRLIRDKLWIPNTPAGRTLYGAKNR